MNIPVSNINYSVATGGNSNNVFITLLQPRDPTSNDVTYQVTQRWVNTSTGIEWILTGFTSFAGAYQASWLQLTYDASGGITWSSETSNFNAVSTNGYYVIGITATLPLAPQLGATISFIALATGFRIQCQAGIKIVIGTAVTSSAGYALNNAIGDSITLVFNSNINEWYSIGAPQGVWTLT